jgi:hypothetical protein
MSTRSLLKQKRDIIGIANVLVACNRRHAQIRDHVECIIGVVQMHFQILKRALYHPTDSQSDIVLACCALQNSICSHEGIESWIERSGLCIEKWEIASRLI